MVKPKPARKHARRKPPLFVAVKAARPGRPTGPRDKVLESVLHEVTAEPESQPLEEWLPVLCPYCGEEFELHATSAEDGQTKTESCDVCCRPVLVMICVEDGEIQAEVQRA